MLWHCTWVFAGWSQMCTLNGVWSDRKIRCYHSSRSSLTHNLSGLSEKVEAMEVFLHLSAGLGGGVRPQNYFSRRHNPLKPKVYKSTDTLEETLRLRALIIPQALPKNHAPAPVQPPRRFPNTLLLTLVPKRLYKAKKLFSTTFPLIRNIKAQHADNQNDIFIRFKYPGIHKNMFRGHCTLYVLRTQIC